MKKMMIIAVMMGAMLIPAQMMASNKVNNKAKVEYRNGKKEFNNKKGYGKADKRFDDKKGFNKNMGYKKKPDRPKDFNRRGPGKPKVIVVNKPAPRPAPRPLPPPPPAPVKVIYESNPANAVASVIGLAALAAIIGN